MPAGCSRRGEGCCSELRVVRLLASEIHVPLPTTPDDPTTHNLQWSQPICQWRAKAIDRFLWQEGRGAQSMAGGRKDPSGLRPDRRGAAPPAGQPPGRRRGVRLPPWPVRRGPLGRRQERGAAVRGRTTPWRRASRPPRASPSTLLHITVEPRSARLRRSASCQHWPEFAQAGKEAITVRQVLAHQSGLYHIRQMIDRADRMLDWDYMIRAIERAAPIHEPGTRTGYHGLTFGYIVGEILQRVTGKSFSRLVQDDLVRRWGSTACTSGRRDEALPRAAELMWPESSVMTPVCRAVAAATASRDAGSEPAAQRPADRAAPGRRAARPAAASSTRSRRNGIGSLRLRRRGDAARGDPGGQRAVHRALAGAHVRGARRRRRDRRRAAAVASDAGARHRGAGAGRAARGDPLRHALAARLPRRRDDARHSQAGASGTSASAARARGPTRGATSRSALIVNSGLGTPFGDLRILRISGAALACANERPGTERARRARRSAWPGWLIPSELWRA